MKEDSPTKDVLTKPLLGGQIHEKLPKRLGDKEGLSGLLGDMLGHIEDTSVIDSFNAVAAEHGGIGSTKDFQQVFSKLSKEEKSTLTSKAIAVYDKIPPEQRATLIEEKLPRHLSKTLSKITDTLDGMSEENRSQMLEVALNNMDESGKIDLAHCEKAMAKIVAKDSMRSLRDWIVHGPTSVRVLGFLASILALLAGISGVFIATVLLFQNRVCMRHGRAVVRIAMNVYLALFGVLMAIIEARKLTYLSGVRQWITYEVHFLNHAEGRGAFYIFMATFALSAWSLHEIVSMIAGVVLLIVGLLNIFMGLSFRSHLKKQLKASEDTVVRIWKQVAGKTCKKCGMEKCTCYSPWPLDSRQFIEFLHISDPSVPKMTESQFKDFSSEFNAKYEDYISLNEYLEYRKRAKLENIKHFLL
eukprot:g6428.t1